MSNKIIIELELLVPRKYEQVFWRDMVIGAKPLIYDITKTRELRGRKTNIAIIEGQERLKRVNGPEDYEGFERIFYFMSDDRHKIEYPERYELRGLLQEEYTQSCNLYYKILNFPDDGLRRLRQHNDNVKCFVKPSLLDKNTIDIFGDIYEEL